MSSNKKILYIDLDGVIVNFESGIERLSKEHKIKYIDRYKNVPGIFGLMKPIPNAINSVKKLCDYYDVFILSTAPWDNPSAWSDKVKWIKKYFGSHDGSILYKKMILTHRKDLNHGHILIDDRTKNGADKFNGELILFGSDRFPDWDTVVGYLLNR